MASERVLVLGGVKLRCLDELPAGMLFDLVEVGVEAGETIIGDARLIRGIVVDADQEKLKRVLYDKKNVVTYQKVSTALRTLLSEYANLPLEQSLPSLPGSEPTGQSMRHVSLSRDTEKTSISESGRQVKSSG